MCWLSTLSICPAGLSSAYVSDCLPPFANRNVTDNCSVLERTLSKFQPRNLPVLADSYRLGNYKCQYIFCYVLQSCPTIRNLQHSRISPRRSWWFPSGPTNSTHCQCGSVWVPFPQYEFYFHAWVYVSI